MKIKQRRIKIEPTIKLNCNANIRHCFTKGSLRHNRLAVFLVTFVIHFSVFLFFFESIMTLRQKPSVFQL